MSNITREDIIRMAREASNNASGLYEEDSDLVMLYFDELERFAALVAAAAVRETSAEYRMGWNDGQTNEREACAQLCENKGLVWKSRENINPEVAEKAYMASTFIAAAIRARGNT